VNNDGYDDIIIGADGALSSAGISYVIFGKANGFTNINLSSLTSAQGFKIIGANNNDNSGRSVSGAGDVNGDGYDDIIVGAPGAYPQGITEAGESYVIFGKNSGFSDINIASLSTTQGFKIAGSAGIDDLGRSVSGAGDVNNDGFDDVVVGAPHCFISGSGYSGVIYGHSGTFPDLIVRDLTDAQGIVIYGAAIYDCTGTSVSSAGDVNGDGYNDILIGAPQAFGAGAGKSYIIFGYDNGGMISSSTSILTGSSGTSSGSNIPSSSGIPNDANTHDAYLLLPIVGALVCQALVEGFDWL
jgi:hypothetical protein